LGQLTTRILSLLTALLAWPGHGAEASGTGLPYLRVSGTQLVTPDGTKVVLRGYNLGSWLATEAWMDGSTGTEGRGALEVLETRFGVKAAANLISHWRKQWITTADLDLLRSWGVNALRVPLDYRVLVGPGDVDANGNLQGVSLEQDAATGAVTPTSGKLDFDYLNWIVAQAGARGIYVIFDLHVWDGQISGPGADPYQQISCFCTGAAVEQQQAALLWTAIAAHFKGNGTIAGMDVINEPTGSPGDTVQHVLLDGVRAGDPRRVAFIEWSSTTNFAANFPNSVYSTHYPPVLTQAWVNANLATGVPNYIGEVQVPSGTAADATAMAASLNQFGVSWTVWAYKAVNVGGWAMFNYDAGVATVNPATSPAAAIRAAWTAPLTLWQTQGQDVNSYLNTGLIAAYSAAMTGR
jgi:hypothetical protein